MPDPEEQPAQPQTSSQIQEAGVRVHPAVIGVFIILLVGCLVYIISTFRNAPEATEEEGAGGPPSMGMPPAAVFVETITSVEENDLATVTGTLQAISRAEISARESGAVSEILVNEGDTVKAGAPLVRIDRRRLDAQLAEANAKKTSAESLLEQRKAEQKRAQEDLDMKQGLLQEKAVSESDVLDARRSVIVADAQVNVASDAITEIDSQIDFLEVQIEDLEISAPFDGVVIARHVEDGEWVAAGGVVVSLTKINPIEAWLRVPARYLTSVSDEPSSIRVRLSSSGEVLKPTKVTVVPEVDQRSQLFTVIATIDNPDERLAPGESVTGIIPVSKKEPHWKFPVDALIRTPAGDIVWVAGANSGGVMQASKKTQVEVSFERDGHAYVAAATGSLKEGDQVVTEGNERLQPGQPLMIRTAAPVNDPNTAESP